MQALWDANGAAIYEANQAFKTAYGRNMSASVRRKAIKDATVNGRFNAGAYAGNLVKAATPPPPPKENPYAGAADRIRAAANEIDDEKKIGYVDSERDEVRKLIALNEQKNAPVDSATASYMAMAAADEADKFSKDDYDRAREQAENNALNRGLRAYYDGRKAGEEKKPRPWWKNNKVSTAIGSLGALTGILGDIEIERVKNADDATKLDGRHVNTMWGEGIWNAKNRKWPWQTDTGKSVLAKIKDYQERTALKIGEGMPWKNEIRICN